MTKAVFLGLLALPALPEMAKAADMRFSLFASQGILKQFKESSDLERTSLDETLYNAQFTASTGDGLGIRTEVEGEDTAFADITVGENVISSLDPQIVVAAIEYRPSLPHTFRIGLIRQPFSFFNEYRNISIIHPFNNLPYVYQSIVGNMNKNLRGASYQYEGEWGGTGLNLTAYAGQITLYSVLDENGNVDIAGRMILGETVYSTRLVPLDYRDMFGGQVRLERQDIGLQASLGGFNARRYDGTHTETWYSWISGIQHDTRYSQLIGEWGRVNDISEAYYVMAGIKPNGFIPSLDDYGEFVILGIVDQLLADKSHYSSNFLRNSAVGLRWHVRPDLVLKLNYGYIDVAFLTQKTDSTTVALSVAAAIF